MLVRALRVAVKVTLLPDAALMLLEAMASSVSLGEPEPPQPAGRIAASKSSHRAGLRRALGTKSRISPARLTPPRMPRPRIDADCAAGDAAGVAMVNVAVCPAPTVRLDGVILHVEPAGTPLPQESETVPV